MILSGCQHPDGESNNMGALDRGQRESLRQESPNAYTDIEKGRPLTIADVKALAKAGVSDDVIIAQIQNSHTIFHLTSADIIDLHRAGVSDRVVDYMIDTVNTPNGTPNAVVETSPPPPESEVIVAAPGPGYIWVNGGWEWNGATWIWVGGHWVLPPYPRAVWVPGYWYHGWHGWYRVPGHWRR